MSSRVFTISNFFSFARALLAGPIVYYLAKNTPEGNWTALLLMGIAIATDFIDGFLARKLNQRSDVGRIIDPLADKIGVGAIAITLVIFRDLPAWFLIVIIVRDLAILALGIFMVSKSKEIPESNWYGKIAVAALALMLVTFVLSLDSFKWYILYLALIFLILSTASYLKRFMVFLHKG